MNGLSPVRHQYKTSTDCGLLLIGPPEANSSEISIEFQSFPFKKKSAKLLIGFIFSLRLDDI